jgi:FMN phosphatase YigB (HAD superfamily)
VRTGILSNSFVGAREREQDRYGFEDRCDVIAYSHEIGVMKPDPTAYTRSVTSSRSSHARRSFSTTSRSCVAGAEAVGMKAVRFRDNEQAIAEIEARLDEATDLV